MDKTSVLVRFPNKLIERIEYYQMEKGFSTRTQTIFHLIQVGLNNEEKKKQ